MVNEDGHSEVEMRCRIQQGANARGKVEGVMLDRNILKKLKRKLLRVCVTPACLYLYLETVALTEQQQQLQVWFWFRRIIRKKRVDERRMNDLRKDGMQQDSWTGILVRSKVRWAGHMPHGKDGCRHTSKESGRDRWKNIKDARKGEANS